MRHLKFSSFLLVSVLFFIFSCSKKDSSPGQVEDLVTQAEKDAVFEAVLIKADDQINKDTNAGNDIHLTGTPTIVINGVKLSSIPQSVADFVTLISKARAAATPTPAITPSISLETL